MSIGQDEEQRQEQQRTLNSSVEDIEEPTETEKAVFAFKTGEQSSRAALTEDIIEKHLLAQLTRTGKEEDDSRSLSEDICRICHMGGSSPVSNNKNQSKSQVEEKQTRLSAFSSYAYLGPLISVCKCRGTVGLVHADCLEKWLTESGHTRCELCGYKYTTKRVPRHSIYRSLIIWFHTVVATRQMFLDVLYLAVTTPLALFACYICVLALKLLIESGFYQVPWVIVAMLPTCSLTLVAYWAWLMTLGRLHVRRWRRYWRNNFVVRLQTENINNQENEQSDESSSVNDFYWEFENDQLLGRD